MTPKELDQWEAEAKTSTQYPSSSRILALIEIVHAFKYAGTYWLEQTGDACTCGYFESKNETGEEFPLLDSVWCLCGPCSMKKALALTEELE